MPDPKPPRPTAPQRAEGGPTASPAAPGRLGTPEADLIDAALREAQCVPSPEATPAAGSPRDDTGTTPAEASPHGLPASLIQGYQILREIHRGGQGVVYQALQKSTQRKVAIKVLHEGPFAAPRSRARFEREVQILGALNHPNIVNIHDSGRTAGDALYYVMDYVRGQSLREFVRERKLPLAAALELFATVCEAVQHAHVRGIIHRDLKPANILVDSDGRPIVVDFGYGKLLAGTADALSLTQDVMGTLAYMSPEQTRGNPDQIDARSDVYSLGVILYELLTGTFPYPVTGNLRDVLENIVHTAPVRPSTVRHQLRADLETIVLKCLNKQPERRYQSAGELAHDLRRYLAGEPIEAKRDSLLYVLGTRARRQARFHPIVAHLLVIAVTTLLVQSLAAPLVDKWTPLNERYEQWLTVLFTPRMAAGFERVRVIAIRDGLDVEALARREGVEGVSASDRTSQRRLHGKLMQQLARSGARAVVWDVMFRTSRDFDADFVAGVRALRASGADVVVAAPNWRRDAQNLPELSTIILPEVRWGAAVKDVNLWQFPLVLRRSGQEPMLALALEALAAARQPGTKAAVEWDGASASIRLLYWTPNPLSPADPRVRNLVGNPERLELSGRHVSTQSNPEAGVLLGDDIAYWVPVMPPDGALTAATTDYEAVFAADDQQLRDWFAGKIIVIGWLEPRERVPCPGRDSVFGCYCHAAIIEQLETAIGNRLPRVSPLGIYAFMSALGTAAGLAAPIRRSRRLRLVAIVVVSIALTSLGLAYARGYLFNPIVAVPAVLLASELSAAVRRAGGMSSEQFF